MKTYVAYVSTDGEPCYPTHIVAGEAKDGTPITVCNRHMTPIDRGRWKSGSNKQEQFKYLDVPAKPVCSRCDGSRDALKREHYQRAGIVG